MRFGTGGVLLAASCVLGCHRGDTDRPLAQTDAGIGVARDAQAGEHDALTPPAPLTPSGAVTVASMADLPPCDAARQTWVGITADDRTFYECRDGVWVKVDAARASGSRIDVEPAGVHCVSGGNAFHTGIDQNQNGRLEDEEITSTTYACSPPPRLENSVDLLLMIDNSGSMKEEQASLSRELPKMIRTLAEGRPARADGDVALLPVQSVHIGVVTSNMGINGVSGIDGCSGVGQDGLMQTRSVGFQVDPITGSMSSESCDAARLTTTSGAPYLTYEAKVTSADALSADASCITQQGTGGCGFEQQLEAIWKALAPSTDLSFSNGSAGHGDAANAGFLRKNSVLVVVAVSDEEDCSIPDASRDIFAPVPTDPRFRNAEGKVEGVNARCALHAADGTLHAVGRYVDGLRSLRPERPESIIFASLVGVPTAAAGMVSADGTQDFSSILAMPEMQIAFLKSDPIALQSASGVLPDPACRSERGMASPARRFVQVAQGFGSNGLVRSICTEDFGEFTEAILQKIARLQ